MLFQRLLMCCCFFNSLVLELSSRRSSPSSQLDNLVFEDFARLRLTKTHDERDGGNLLLWVHALSLNQPILILWVKDSVEKVRALDIRHSTSWYLALWSQSGKEKCCFYVSSCSFMTTAFTTSWFVRHHFMHFMHTHTHFFIQTSSFLINKLECSAFINPTLGEIPNNDELMMDFQYICFHCSTRTAIFTDLLSHITYVFSCPLAIGKKQQHSVITRHKSASAFAWLYHNVMEQNQLNEWNSDADTFNYINYVLNLKENYIPLTINTSLSNTNRPLVICYWLNSHQNNRCSFVD